MCKLSEIKDYLIDMAYENLETADTKELYEVIDMIKDIEQAKYYKTLRQAMEDESYTPEEKVAIVKAATEA